MNKSKIQAIVTQVLTNATEIQYGSVSVTLKLHDGQIVSVSYTTTVQTREPANEQEISSVDSKNRISPAIQENEKDRTNDFQERTSDKPVAGQKTYLTIEELADYLKLAQQTIRRWVLNDEIPYHKISKVIRFRVSEIEKWIDEGGYILADVPQAGVESSLFEDVISLDELAELELAEEEAEDYE